MKINYLKAFGLALLLSSSVYSQKNEKYNGDKAFQKTINLNGFYSSENAIKEFSKLYSLTDLNSFVPKKSTSDEAGFTHQRFQQFYNGIKVEFGTLITHMKDGNVVSVNGELYSAEGLNLNSSLTALDAFNKALAFVNAQSYLWDDKASADAMNYTKPTGELVVFPVVNRGEVRLAYKFDIYAKMPISRDEIFVDANTGEILYKNPIIKHATHLISEYEVEQNAKKFEKIALNKENALFTPFVAGSAATRYSGTRTIETTQTGPNSFVLNEATRGNGNGVVTYNCQKTDTYPTTNFVDNDNNWIEQNNANKDNAALDAHWGAEKTYDFWKAIFNRNSFDDAGAKIKSYVHYDNTPATPAGYQNAFWNGNVMTYGDGSTRPFTALDVCGHEIGHAVCSYTADLAYQNQSGAMNEALSDIWGTCIEIYGRNGNLNATADTASPGTLALWKIGEDLSSTGNSLRSMSYPTTKGNPDTYRGTNWSTTADDGNCTPSSTNDHCGVHNNSGVLNHWFYLLTIGKTNWTNNAAPTRTTTTTGIGMAKSSQITYYAERDYLTSNATYMDMRNATTIVAKNTFGCGSAEHLAVMNCWYAVNLGVRYTDLDLNLSSITGDSNLACGASHSISFVLENQGSTSISSATITYSIDGGAQVPVSWTGSALSTCLNPSQNYTISFGALSRGTHAIVVTATLAGDTNTSNNSKTTYVTVNDSGTVGTVNTFNNTSDVLVSVDANGKANSVWQRGAINKSYLTNTLAGSNVYATKLIENYPDATTSYLVSQCYDLSNVANPAVSFDMAFDLESNWDIIYFEYSTDSGATWNVLGTSSDANWYNSSRFPNGTDCFNCIGKQWTGDFAVAPAGGTGVDGGKRAYTHSLTSLGSASNAIFRFAFKSDDASSQEGVMIDNFLIQGVLSAQSNQIDGFALYPNPTKGKLNISLPTSDKVTVELFDLRGRSIYQNNFEAQGSLFTKELDFSNAQAGVYILNVKTEGKQVSKRIIIE